MMNQFIENAKGLIFDLDGTLVNSMPVWKNIERNFLRRHGIEPPEDIHETLKTLSIEGAAEYFVDHFSLQMSETEVIEEIIEMMQENYAKNILLKPGVHEFIQQCHRMGKKMAVLSATNCSLVEVVLNRFELRNYFEFILTCEMVGLSKREPEIFQQAIRKLNVEPQEIIVFEDALHCIQSAKQTGCRLVGIYDECAAEDWETICATVDHGIMSFEELIK